MPYVGRTPTPSPVTIDDIPANSIDASKIVDGSIEVSDIKDNSITDAKLNSTKLDGIADSANNYSHPAAHATADIADNAITDAKLNSTKLDGIADSANNYSHPAAHTVSEVTGLQGLLDGKTTETYVNTQVAALVASSPATLDTLNELATALGNDPNFATTVTNSIGTKLPLAGGTMTGDVSLGDNVKAKFGASDDLQIYHDTTYGHSVIEEIGTGNLTLRGDNLYLTRQGTGDNYLGATADGAVKIYYDGAEKLATTSTGIDVTGLLKVGINDTEYANNYVRFKPTGASYIDHNTVGQALNFRLSNASSLDKTVMVLTSSGKVGIGTSSPLRDFQVVGSLGVTDASGEHYGVDISGGEGSDPKIRIGDWHNDSGTIKWDSSSNHLSIDTHYTSGAGTFKITGGDGASEFMRITSAGNVGIGTSTLNSNKAVIEGGVAGSNSSTLALKTGSGANSKVADLAFYGTFVTPTSDQGQRRTADITSGFSTANWGTEYLAFGVGVGGTTNDAANVTSEKVRIDSAGNVGIGTATPAAKMDVSGDIGLKTNLAVGGSSGTHPLGNTADGQIIKTPMYTDYQYLWSGNNRTHTTELICGSYAHFEITYVQTQTNGGGHSSQGIHRYIRGIWTNNHNSHTWNVLEQLGGGGTVSLTISVGQNSTTASGKLTITEVVGGGSYAYSKLQVRTYFGDHGIAHNET